MIPVPVIGFALWQAWLAANYTADDAFRWVIMFYVAMCFGAFFIGPLFG